VSWPGSTSSPAKHTKIQILGFSINCRRGIVFSFLQRLTVHAFTDCQLLLECVSSPRVRCVQSCVAVQDMAYHQQCTYMTSGLPNGRSKGACVGSLVCREHGTMYEMHVRFFMNKKLITIRNAAQACNSSNDLPISCLKNTYCNPCVSGGQAGTHIACSTQHTFTHIKSCST